MIRQLGILAVAMVMAVGAGAAQPANDDLAKLQEEVARINVQQQQILASLDELKKMMKGPAQPALFGREVESALSSRVRRCGVPTAR